MSSAPTTPTLLRLIDTVVHAHKPWRAVLAALTVVVLYLALIPMPPKAMDFGWDKINHCFAFAALTVSACFGYPGSRRTVVMVMLALLGLGGLIEILQYFVPPRSSDWHDLVADAVGIAVGSGIALPLLRLTDPRRHTG